MRNHIHLNLQVMSKIQKKTNCVKSKSFTRKNFFLRLKQQCLFQYLINLTIKLKSSENYKTNFQRYISHLLWSDIKYSNIPSFKK